MRPPSANPGQSRSESPLSDVGDLPTTTVSSITGPQDEDHSEDDAIHDMATSELDDEEDAPGEDDEEEDAEFDEETPPPEDDLQRSPSESSLRPGKRKAESPIDDEEYMKQNPELYGLRRSVCAFAICANRKSIADLNLRRAVQDLLVEWYVHCVIISRIVEAIAYAHLQVDSSDEDEDEDDVNTGRRRKRQKTAGTRPSM